MAPFLQWETCHMPCKRALAHIRQARDRQAVLGIQGAGLDPILSAGWGQGTREKDVRPHRCSSISPQSVGPSKACVWSVWSLKARGGSRTHFLRIPGSVSFCWKSISETASGIYGSRVMNALRASSGRRSPELRSGFAVVTGSPKDKWRQLRKTHPNPTRGLA